jgi:hypothetical protein
VRKLERNLLLRVREPCCRVTFWQCRRWRRRLGAGLFSLAFLFLVGLAPLRKPRARHQVEAVQIFRRENPKRCGMAAVLCRSGAKWVAASDVGAPLRCAGLVTTAKKATLRPVLSPWFVTKGRVGPVPTRVGPVPGDGLGSPPLRSCSLTRPVHRRSSSDVSQIDAGRNSGLREVTTPLPPWKEERRKSLRRGPKADYEIAARRLLRHPARRVERHFCYEGNEPEQKIYSTPQVTRAPSATPAAATSVLHLHQELRTTWIFTATILSTPTRVSRVFLLLGAGATCNTWRQDHRTSGLPS